MSRLAPVDPSTAEGKTKELLDKVQSKLGRLPNIFKHFAVSPAVLEAYLGLSEALNNASLSQQIREQIALAIGEENGCDYCLAAHSAIGKMAGLDAEAIQLSRQATAKEPKVAAILQFALKVVKDRAEVSDADVQTLKEAGVSDAEIAEIITAITLNLFTNYFNHIVDPEIDFPKAQPIAASTSS